MTTVSEIMTRGVRSKSRNDRIMQAAQAMDDLNSAASGSPGGGSASGSASRMPG